MRAIFVGVVTRVNDVVQVGQRQTPLLTLHVKDLSVSYGGKQKEWECQLWGKAAENAVVPVGGIFFIDGKLEENEYTNKEGQKRTSLRINVSEIVPCEAPAEPARKERPATPQAEFNFQQEEKPKDDLYQRAEQEKRESDPDDELPF